MTYQEGMDLFLRHKAPTVTGAYYQNCHGRVQGFGDFIGRGTSIASLSDQTVTEWIDQIRPKAVNQISSKAQVNKVAIITAMLGTNELSIKRHFFMRMSREEAQAFYAIMPSNL